MTSPAAGTPVNRENHGELADGAAALNINWNLYDSNGNPLLTQFAEASAASGTTQDGVQPGTATGVTLQNGGELVASYSNGQQVTIAQVAVASIANPDTLIAASNNNFTLGTDTLTPSVGAAGTGDRGTIVGGSIEGSNVDMATEFTNLIVYQRGYEAASKVITTQNQMDQMLLAHPAVIELDKGPRLDNRRKSCALRHTLLCPSNPSWAGAPCPCARSSPSRRAV